MCDIHRMERHQEMQFVTQEKLCRFAQLEGKSFVEKEKESKKTVRCVEWVVSF